jgi:ribosome-associated heat shock protein Hsp15
MPDARSPSSPSPAAARLDRWLWMARFFKSRTRATAFTETARIRLNEVPVGKAHALVRPGDVLTFSLADRIRIIRIVALPARRGPADEARLLYEDLAAASNALAAAQAEAGPPPAAAGARDPGSGRPTKRDRRRLDRLCPD